MFQTHHLRRLGIYLALAYATLTHVGFVYSIYYKLAPLLMRPGMRCTLILSMSSRLQFLAPSLPLHTLDT